MPHSLLPNRNQERQPKQFLKKQHLSFWSLSRTRALRLEEVPRLPTTSRVLVRLQRSSAWPASFCVSQGLLTTFSEYKHLTSCCACHSWITDQRFVAVALLKAAWTDCLKQPRRVSVHGSGAESCMELAAAAGSVKGLVQQLEVVFPSAIGSAKRAKPLKDLYAAIFPGTDPTQVSPLPQK